MIQAPNVFLWAVLLSVGLVAAGCCGVGTGPSQADAEQSLSQLIGKPTADAKRYLKSCGFHAVDLGAVDDGLSYKRTDTCLFLEDIKFVVLIAGASDRLQSFRVHYSRMSP